MYKYIIYRLSLIRCTVFSQLLLLQLLHHHASNTSLGTGLDTSLGTGLGTVLGTSLNPLAMKVLSMKRIETVHIHVDVHVYVGG